jgi:hypothetical protein
MGLYLGMKEKARPQIFESEAEPTKETRPQYDFTYGAFKTTDDAKQYVKAMTGLACGEG